jgi:hypothetical protein
VITGVTTSFVEVLIIAQKRAVDVSANGEPLEKSIVFAFKQLVISTID